MKILHCTQVLEELCKATKKWGMFINIYIPELKECPNPYEEVMKAAPYLNMDDDYQAISDGQAWLLFDSEEEMQKTYNITVGDEGPTESNNYNGPCKVYALTCDSNGQLLNENT